MPVQRPPRDVAAGILIAAGFGVLWVFYGTAGLPAPAGIALRVLAVLLLVAIVLRMVWLLRVGEPVPGGAGGRSMFRSRPYLVIVALEVAALVVGLVVLRSIGLDAYRVPWIGLVVGVHFLGFGRFFQPRFYRLGAIQIVFALAGVGTGLAGGSAAAIAAVTGLASGALYLAGTLLVVLRGRFGATMMSPP